MPKRKARQSGGGGAMAAIILILLVIAVIAACKVYQAQQPPTAANPPGSQPNLIDGSATPLISDDRIIYGGIPRQLPGSPAPLSFEVLKNRAYMVGYSEERRDPLWSAYRVFHNPNPYNLPRPTGGFLTDSRTSAHVRDNDFTRSGYDRGHMTPNSAIMRDYGAQAQLETFLLSNICPQSPALNEKVWERLEADERKYADNLEEIWVIDGPIFADLNGGTTDRLATGIAVPSAFYKIILDEQNAPGGKPRLFAVIMPQNVKGTELPQQFLTSVHEIEKQTTLDFFWKLDPATQAQLEEKVWPMWGLSN